MNKFNYHTHSTFCDGKNTLRETVIQATKLGMSALGFSGHASMPELRGGDTSYAMTTDGTVLYRAETAKLKEEFKNKIKIYCGIEKDYYSTDDFDGYDFIIGSVHYVEKHGFYYDIDLRREYLQHVIDTQWNSDADAYAIDYFHLAKSLHDKTHCSIIGHFDLLSKFNEDGQMFDETSEKYLSAAEEAVKYLAKQDVLFEINTGAMDRNLRSRPYPAPSIMKMIKNARGKVTFSSDCHCADKLLFGFDDALTYIKKFGFEGFGTICDRKYLYKN